MPFIWNKNVQEFFFQLPPFGPNLYGIPTEDRGPCIDSAPPWVVEHCNHRRSVVCPSRNIFSFVVCNIRKRKIIFYSASIKTLMRSSKIFSSNSPIISNGTRFLSRFLYRPFVKPCLICQTRKTRVRVIFSNTLVMIGC